MAIQIENLLKFELDWNTNYSNTDITDEFRLYFGNFNSYEYSNTSYSDSYAYNSPQFFSPDKIYYTEMGREEISANEGKHTNRNYINVKSNHSTAINFDITYYGKPGATSSFILDTITPILCNIAQDSTYTYYLFSLMEYARYSDGYYKYAASDIILRTVNGKTIFTDNILTTKDAGPLASSGYYPPVKYLEASKDTTIWTTNSTGELAYIHPTKTNFTNNILDSNRKNLSIIGGNVANNTVLVLKENYLVEKYEYNIATNELSLISIKDISHYGYAVATTYDYELDLGYILVYNNTNQAYRLVAIESSANEIWAASGDINIWKHPSTGTVYRYVLGIATMYGAIAILTRELGYDANQPRYVNLWLLTKQNFQLLDLGYLGTLNNFSTSNLPSFYAESSNFNYSNNWRQQLINIDNSSLRFYNHVSTSNYFAWFMAGQVSINNELFGLDNILPRTFSISQIPLIPVVGMNCVNAPIEFYINPDAWSPNLAIDLDCVIDGYWMLNEIHPTLDFGINATAYNYALETVNLDFSMLAEMWGSHSYLDLNMLIESWGVSSPLTPSLSGILVQGGDGTVRNLEIDFDIYGQCVKYWSDVHLVFYSDTVLHNSPFEVNAVMVTEQKYDVKLNLKTFSIEVEMYSGGYAKNELPFDINIEAIFPNIAEAELSIPLDIRTKIISGQASGTDALIPFTVKSKMFQMYPIRGDMVFKLIPVVKGAVGHIGASTLTIPFKLETESVIRKDTVSQGRLRVDRNNIKVIARMV